MGWIGFGFLALAGMLSRLGNACEEDLKVREFLPLDGAENVPINSRLVVAFIGMGTLEDFEIKVYNGAALHHIGLDKEGWCYTHEGPNELHCWARLSPRQELEPWTTYEIQVRRLSEDTGEIEEEAVIGAFTTSDQQASSLVSTLGLTVTDAWEMDSAKLDSCDWDQVSRWWLEVDPISSDPTGLELFHIYELDEAGEPNTSDPIHTIFSPSNSNPQEVKQYLDGAEEHSDCFAIQREGPTGFLGAMSTACFEDSKKGSDSGEPWKTDSGEDPEDTDMTEEPDSAEDGNEVEPVYPVPSCGCASVGSGPGWWMLCWMGVLGVLGRRTPPFSSRLHLG